MLLIGLSFLSFFSFVHCQRYYGFIETLFVIDPNYFPELSEISREEYIRIMVDTTNIVFQSQNDLDVKIEVIVSSVLHLNIVQPFAREPYEYESALRQHVTDYDRYRTWNCGRGRIAVLSGNLHRYDSIVLLWYQPWEGPNGAQGYAMLEGLCHSSRKIMYLVPHQNAAFYLAHELGHQFGLVHQDDTACYTNSYMTVMTKSHTASYEQARWSKCENDWINRKICQFHCVFNKPENYQPIENKLATRPGQRMSNNQQAKMIEHNAQVKGEVSAYTYMPTTFESRCLYFRHYTGESNGGELFSRYFRSRKIRFSGYKTACTPMLPGSECGPNSVCYRDRCVSTGVLDPSLSAIKHDNDILDLTSHCSSDNDPERLKASNHDPHAKMECVNWENDFLCGQSTQCPKAGDSSTLGLYINHVCCAKCVPNPQAIFNALSRARTNSRCFALLPFLSIGFFIMSRIK